MRVTLGEGLHFEVPSTQVSAERSAADGEVPALSIELDNTRGQHTALFCPPPLGAALVLGDFAGTVQAVRLGATIVIEAEA